MTPVWVIGNGGHAKVLVDAINAGGVFTVAGLISDTPNGAAVVPGLPHVWPINLDVVREYGAERAVIGIGDNSARLRIASLLNGLIKWVAVVHPTAIVAPSATLGAGVFLAAGSILQPSAVIGDHAIVNTGATVDHDCFIGPYAHIAPGAHLAGNVIVGDGTLIGIGAAVIPGVSIGRDATVGAGSVVIRDVADGLKVIGNPARRV